MPSLSKIKNLKNAARKLLLNNRRVSEFNGKKYSYTVPSPSTYPFQWFWDSCFHSIALTHLGDIQQAKSEIESLLTWQGKDGFIPHVIFWDSSKVNRKPWHWNWLESKSFFSFIAFAPKTSAQIQPPVIAQAVERIFKVTKDKTWLKSLLPKLVLYYNWLEKNRDIDEDGLITIISPFESGLDSSPAYDPVFGIKDSSNESQVFWSGRFASLRNKLLDYNQNLINKFGNFLVEAILVNSIYAQGLNSVSRLANMVKKGNISENFKIRSEKAVDSLISKCYDEDAGLFWNLYGKNETQSKIKTIISLMPIILPETPKEIVERIVEEHLKNDEEFYLPYPIPSVAKDEKAFSPDSLIDGKRALWRGSTWINTNWFIIHGLKIHGYTKLADEIATKTREMVAKHGFYEYFNPLTGKAVPSSAQNFGWSTLVIDL